MESNLTQEDNIIVQPGERLRAKSHQRDRFARTMAWFLLGLSVAILLAAVALLLLVPGAARGSNIAGRDFQIGGILLSYSILGALIAARHSKNPIGWIFIAMGITAQLHILAIGIVTYVVFRAPNSIHFPLLAFSILVNPFIIQRVLGPLGLLIFPDGKLISPRWKIIGWLLVGIGAVWYLFSTPGAVAGLPASLFQPIMQAVLPSISHTVSQVIEPVATDLIEILFVIATIGIVQRLRRAKGEQHQQLKWIVFATVIAASITLGLTILDSLPIYASTMSASQTTGMRLVALMPDLAYVLIALAAFIAIYKYHLYDIDLIINRTLVYVPLTAILAGLYAASVTLFQRLFIAYTGQKSDTAVVISALILASTFTPIKNSLQGAVDARFKDPEDPLKELKNFDRQIAAVTEVINTRLVTRKLLEMSLCAFQASGGAIYLKRDGEFTLEHASPEWVEGSGIMQFTMQHAGTQLGKMELGTRKNQKGYSSEECKLLQQAVDHVAEMVWFSQVTARSIDVGE